MPFTVINNYKYSLRLSLFISIDFATLIGKIIPKKIFLSKQDSQYEIS